MKEEEITLSFSKTEQVIMEKDKMGPFYTDEIGVIVLPFLMAGFFGNMLNAMFEVNVLKFFMIASIFSMVMIFVFLKNRDMNNPGYIMHYAYMYGDVMNERLGFLRFRKVETKMKAYDSVRRTVYYN